MKSDHFVADRDYFRAVRHAAATSDLDEIKQILGKIGVWPIFCKREAERDARTTAQARARIERSRTKKTKSTTPQSAPLVR